MIKKFEFQIDEKFHRKRLDEFLFNEFTALSKAYIRRIVKEENCEINGFIANTGIIIRKNDFVEIVVDIKQEKGMKAEQMPLDIVFEDKEIIVINKPCGMLVHPTNYERNGTLLNGLTHYLNQNSNGNLFVRPHLIHRLDRETSGLILIAKNPNASRILCGHFKRKLFEKKYLAMVEGIVEQDTGEINASIGRDELERKWKIKTDAKPSRTIFTVLKRFAEKTLLELEPITGRTNQLRIHCNYIGHTILGDEMHNGRKHSRLCLHSSKLGFWHPNGGKKMTFQSDEIEF
ncbi:MAG: RluA family pseudouridine synthase [Aridibacter sp.]